MAWLSRKVRDSKVWLSRKVRDSQTLLSRKVNLTEPVATWCRHSNRNTTYVAPGALTSSPVLVSGWWCVWGVSQQERNTGGGGVCREGRPGTLQLCSVCIQVNAHKLAEAVFWLYSLCSKLYRIILLSKCNIPTINKRGRVWISPLHFFPFKLVKFQRFLGFFLRWVNPIKFLTSQRQLTSQSPLD